MITPNLDDVNLNHNSKGDKLKIKLGNFSEVPVDWELFWFNDTSKHR